MKRFLVLLVCLPLLLSGCVQINAPAKIPSADGLETLGQPSETPVLPEGGYWRFIKAECNPFEPINDTEHGTYWNGDIRPNYIDATYIVTDWTDVNRPVQYEMVYNYSWRLEITPTGDQEHLYPGSTLQVRMSLEYTGVDPNKLGNRAEMYCGAFKNYPPDNNLKIFGPGGVSEKVVPIEIPTGLSGQQGTVDIVCTGGVQNLTYRYFYEWVE